MSIRSKDAVSISLTYFNHFGSKTGTALILRDEFNREEMIADLASMRDSNTLPFLPSNIPQQSLTMLLDIKVGTKTEQLLIYPEPEEVI